MLEEVEWGEGLEWRRRKRLDVRISHGACGTGETINFPRWRFLYATASVQRRFEDWCSPCRLDSSALCKDAMDLTLPPNGSAEGLKIESQDESYAAVLMLPVLFSA